MHGNQRTAGEDRFLPEGAWEACYSREVKPLVIGEKRRVVLAVDASTTRDYTALVGVEPKRESGLVDVVYCRVWKPVRGLLRLGKPTVDLAESVGAEVLKLHKAGQVAAVVVDPFQLHSLIVEWEKKGIKVIELAQNAGRVEADQGLYDAIVARVVRHYNDPNLNDALKNAVAAETPRGFRLAKEKASKKIDAAVALSMAVYGARLKGVMPGEITVIKDIFANWPPPEGQTFDLEFGWGNWNTLPHPPGVTWRNCPYCGKGCLACAREWKLEYNDPWDQAETTMSHESQAVNNNEPYIETNPEEDRALEVIRKLFNTFGKG
jgi:hypothetical protein